MPPPVTTDTALRRSTLAIVMGGGAGTRLFPLTKDRAKPAVPLAGKYRLVDIPISNCINSGVRQVFVLTQYNSMSLNRHIARTYKFDQFTRGFVEVLAAQQTPDGERWYQGTADAVRQNLRYFIENDYDYYLILSGDQLYRMDFRDVMQQHIKSGAELTIATLPVNERDAKSFGLMRADADGQIREFVEKPKDPEVLKAFRMSPETLKELELDVDEPRYQASMGIYVFNRQTLIECLDNDHMDFGKHIIPTAIRDRKVFTYNFQGYWEDIGTIRSFFEANLDLCKLVPQYDFFDSLAPIFTHARFLPATKINGATIREALLSDGCIITDAHVETAVVGIRSIVESGTTLREVIIMGADYYAGAAGTDPGRPAPGIGHNCRIERTIIDKNVHVGDNTVITPHGKPENMDHELYCIRDGIVVIPKDTVIPAGTWI
ncbi:glucose-1-phosphate adenylyltransferase [Brevifollis gellanilyticus]|uniref:Glucose-1-phosphate adenylyltransferase n=1 Tax=Brevifollis gellanilyticus TaxID=748831 RepID=A0A512MD52_9BACT|nr:glucose-1-phosphate adenylyltransferase [Brevifollis gellanilyticus]GEP44670.1 glucose-1-phosphate adenylyltransferase [Brevifollis gellanilyticus]